MLETFRAENEISDTEVKMPEAMEEKGADTSLLMFTSILNEYVTAGRKLIDDLFADDEKKKIVAEGHEFWEAATPMVAADATWGMTSVGIENMLVIAVTTRATMLVAIELGSSSSRQRIFQLEDRLDKEVEDNREPMARVTQESFNKRKTKADCESIAGGRLQNKIWRPGEMQLKDDVADEQQQNKVWDPGGRD